ncbi:hypothetical protein [Caenimonas koreensis]|uniref:Phasin protein n=1 Tax=Caenimonas koreensis DSM 17982 TaxID=1121255 RepID=A0A844BE52_9BURK|nr:hypothetical protein [Caenimonas koreensis]MRD49717.1 hypothetical protein [Caenimonas koreensis DSM 17982]
MQTQSFQSTATTFIASFGNNAHSAISMYRDAGERIAGIVDQRWKAALKESSPHLSAETKKNAAHAKHVIGGYYARGLALSADGAKVAVDTVVGAAIAAVERAASLKQAYEQKTAQ